MIAVTSVTKCSLGHCGFLSIIPSSRGLDPAREFHEHVECRRQLKWWARSMPTMTADSGQPVQACVGTPDHEHALSAPALLGLGAAAFCGANLQQRDIRADLQREL